VTAAQLELAWVHHQGSDVVPIPGTKRRQYLEENVAATEIDLTADDLRRLDQAAPPGVTAGTGVTAGDRYPDMSTVEG
jgi:aryl-alcohol dehydrogenase-like predicted oxidoreductase